MCWKILFLISSIMFLTVAWAEGICPQRNMIFHSATESCFQFGRSAKSVFACKSDCKNLGGYRARILDQVTYTFIERYIKSYQYSYWIGLSDAGFPQKRYEWEGSSDTQVPFEKWARGEPSKKSALNYVIFSSHGWLKRDGNNNYRCLCQAPAAIPPVRLTASSPIQEGQTAQDILTCTFRTSSNIILSWYRPQSDRVVVSCYSNAKCQSHTATYQASISNGVSTLKILKVSRNDEGTWKCVLSTPQKRLLNEASTKVYVYAPADDVQCSQTLAPTGIKATCGVNRIYPQPVCRWEYKYGKQGYMTFQHNIIFKSLNTSTFWEKNVPYYKGTCDMTLAKDKFRFVEGTLSLKLTVDPSVVDMNNDESSVSKEMSFSIEKPKSPGFKFSSNGTRLGTSVTFVAGEKVDLFCFAYHGTPPVEKTKVTCTFRFVVGKDKTPHFAEEWSGQSVKISDVARSEMNGKKCSCSGTHLTGATEMTELVFHVLYPVNIERFQPTIYYSVRTSYKILNNAHLKLKCSFSGKPSASATIQHSGSSQPLTTELVSRGVVAKFTTSCSDNGKYTCTAKNVIQGKTHIDRKTVDINIPCPPTPCTEEDKNRTFSANVGEKLTVQLCVFANPKPSTESIAFYHNGKNFKDYNISYSAYENAKFEIKLKLDLKEKLSGMYTMYHNNNKAILKFHIKLKGVPFCPSDLAVLDVGHHNIQLQWRPAPNHALDDYYVIYHHSNDDDILMSLDQILPNRTSFSLENVTYSLDGLESGRSYNISVGTKNSLGERVCGENWLQATTTEREDNSVSGVSWILTVIVIIAVFAGVVLVMIVVVMVVKRQRKKETRKNDQGLTLMNMDNGQSTRNAINKEEEREGEEEEEQEQEQEQEKIAGADTAQVYAEVHKKSSKEKSYNTRKEPANHTAENNIYNNVASTTTTDDPYSDQCQPILKDDETSTDTGELYANSSYADMKEDLSEEKRSQGVKSTKSKERELVYLSLDFDSSNKRFKVKEDKRQEKPVLYSTIDFVATKQMEEKMDEG